MPNNPKTVGEKLAKVLQAWEDLRPAKSFADMTLAEFKEAVKPSLDAREEITRLENLLTVECDTRDDADKVTAQLILDVVNAVKADKTEGGENGALYEAMGYVRKSERNSGLTKKTTTPTPPPA